MISCGNLQVLCELFSKVFSVQPVISIYIQGVQLKSGLYFNISKPISEPNEIQVCALSFRKDLWGDLVIAV